MTNAPYDRELIRSGGVSRRVRRRRQAASGPARRRARRPARRPRIVVGRSLRADPVAGRPARSWGSWRRAPRACGPPPSTRPVSTAGFPSTALLGPLNGSERVNVLMVGYGGGDHDGAYLADSIQILSIDPSTDTTTTHPDPARPVDRGGRQPSARTARSTRSSRTGTRRRRSTKPARSTAPTARPVRRDRARHRPLAVHRLRRLPRHGRRRRRRDGRQPGRLRVHHERGAAPGGQLGRRAASRPARSTWTASRRWPTRAPGTRAWSPSRPTSPARCGRRASWAPCARRSATGGIGSILPGLGLMDAMEGRVRTDLSAIDLFLLSSHLASDRRIELRRARC